MTQRHRARTRRVSEANLLLSSVRFGNSGRQARLKQMSISEITNLFLSGGLIILGPLLLGAVFAYALMRRGKGAQVRLAEDHPAQRRSSFPADQQNSGRGGWSTSTKLVMWTCVAACILLLGGFYFYPGDNFRAGPQNANVDPGGKPGSGPPLVDNDPPPRGRVSHPAR